MRWAAFIGAWVLGIFATQLGQAEEWAKGCYRFVYESKDFSASEVEAFASMADTRCLNLQRLLGVSRKEPITVYLKPGEGESDTVPHENRAIDLYYLRPISGIEAPLVHETTHILVGSEVAVLREGLATAMEAQLGSLRSHPTYGLSLDDWMAAIRCARRYLVLGKLEAMDWRSGPWETAIITYVESGSFLRFLMDRHGVNRVVRAVQDLGRSLEEICQRHFNDSLESLENEWGRRVDGLGLGREAFALCGAIKDGTTKSLLVQRLSFP
jgi:hypothetical protein